MLYYSKEIINKLEASGSRDKGQCKQNWALFGNSLLSKHIGMIGSSHSMVSDEIGLKSSIMNLGNWVIFGMNAQENRQVDPMLMA